MFLSTTFPVESVSQIMLSTEMQQIKVTSKD